MDKTALLSVREASEEIFGKFSSGNRKRVYELINDGKLETVRIGKGQYFIPRRVINEWRGDE